jgi:hypothetical protein
MDMFGGLSLCWWKRQWLEAVWLRRRDRREVPSLRLSCRHSILATSTCSAAALPASIKSASPLPRILIMHTCHADPTCDLPAQA